MSLVTKNASILAVILAFASYSLGSGFLGCLDTKDSTSTLSVASTLAENANDAKALVSGDPCHNNDAKSGEHPDCSCSCHGGSIFLSEQLNIVLHPSNASLSDYSQSEYSVYLGPSSPPPKFS